MNQGLGWEHGPLILLFFFAAFASFMALSQFAYHRFSRRPTLLELASHIVGLISFWSVLMTVFFIAYFRFGGAIVLAYAFVGFHAIPFLYYTRLESAARRSIVRTCSLTLLACFVSSLGYMAIAGVRLPPV